MTEQQKKSIRNLRRAGLSYAAIGEAMGLSANTVKSFCRRESIDRPVLPDVRNGPVCKNCGEPLLMLPGHKPKLFCCDHCRWDWWNHHRFLMGRRRKEGHP